MTKLASALPAGDGNGLDALHRDLVRDPAKVHVVLALVDCSKTTTNNDTGEVEPTVRVRRIEAVTDPGDKDLTQHMLRRALERRTGKAVLPFELEEDIRLAFDLVAAEDDDPLD